MQHGSRAFFRHLLDHLYDGVYYVNRQGRITFWNRAAARIAGFTAAEVTNKRCSDNLLRHVNHEGVNLCENGCPLRATMGDGQPRQASVFMHHKDGHRLPVSVRVSPVTDTRGEIVGAVEVFSDNSATLAALERLRELEAEAYLDGLTGVANRKYTKIFLDAKFNELARYGWRFGLIFGDIDHFKQVNDTHGHLVGDLVLKMVAQTLARNMRSFDLVGRWGGEEFVCVVSHVEEPERLFETGERLRRLIEHSFVTAGDRTVGVTISLGAALATPADTPASLLQRADALLYQSKAAGRNRLTL